MRVVRFGIVGVSGIGVNLATVEVATRTLLKVAAMSNLVHYVALAFGIVVSIFSNFLLNDAWTWGDRAKGPWLRRCRDFYVSSAAAASVQWVVASLVVSYLEPPSGVWPIDPATIQRAAAVLLAVGLAMPLNFMMNHFWTFRDRRS